MEKGEISVVKIPKNDGHEQYGTRPAVVLSDTDDDIAIVIPFTSNTQALKFPNTLKVEPNSENGLDQTSIALIFQTRAIDEKRLQGKIGKLGQDKIQEIDSKLKNILNL
ncbi:MAG: type II toxin-antitoxin system PemK/MazF family toxin [Candidatus Nanohalobium sp.]